MESLCSSPGYAHALALLCYRDTYVRYNRELKATDMDHMFSRSRLIRTEISTLTGLMIKRPVDFAFPGLDTIQRYVDRTESLLEELHHTMSSAMLQELFDEDGKTLALKSTRSAASIREPIFYGGESAYGFQYRDLAVRKYSTDDPWLLQHKGFTIAQASAVVTAVAKLQDSKVLKAHRSLLSSPPETRTILPGFSFSAEELAAQMGLDGAKVRSILDAFTVPDGAANGSFTALSEYNAINGTPLIRKGSEYVLFQQYSLFEALYEGPFYWLNTDPGYSPTALAHRGRFTEEFAYDRLVHVFGKDKVHINVDVWKKKGVKLGEIDVLVVFGNRAIVLQAKAKRLTLEARKGNDRQIKSDFKKAIQESYDQAYLCAAALTQQDINLTDSAGQQIQVRPLDVIYPVSIVADHYPALSVQAREFLQVQTAPKIVAPLVTDVFALDAMAEMLDTPLHFLSYLDLRARFGSQLMTMHEHTALSYHLKRNLWLSGEYDTVVLEDDIAADLDVAMAVRREGLSGKRTPDGILTRLRNTPAGQILSEIERSPDPRTVDLGLLLLQMSEGSADSLNGGIRQIRAATWRDGKNHDITLGFSGASAGVTVHCNGAPEMVAASTLRLHCEARKYTQKAGTWFGLVISPADASIRLGLKLDYPWVADPQMDARVNSLDAGSVQARSGGSDARQKVGRNDPCPCGSGKKHKKCCLPK